MSKNITTAIACLKAQAEEVEEKIDKINPEDTVGCASCGYLTKANIDADQEVRTLIAELSEISEALSYLESLL